MKKINYSCHLNYKFTPTGCQINNTRYKGCVKTPLRNKSRIRLSKNDRFTFGDPAIQFPLRKIGDLEDLGRVENLQMSI